jgi:hypothetical protein
VKRTIKAEQLLLPPQGLAKVLQECLEKIIEGAFLFFA